MDVDDSVTTSGLNGIVTLPHRVPPEIVARIIHELLPTKTDYGIQIQKRLDVLLTATSICRYWRYAALDHATLWSVIPIDRRSLGERFLERSRNVSLTVTFEVKTRRCCPAHQAMVSLLPHVQRVEKVHLRAPAAVLNEILSTFNRFMHGAQLKEIGVQAEEFSGDEKCRFTLDLLLKHAPTLKVLRSGALGRRLPDLKLRQLSHLSHLELLASYDIRDVLSLLTSLPALTSTKVRVNAIMRHADDHRVILQASLRHIRLQIADDYPNRVLDALKIPTGVRLECEIMAVPLWGFTGGRTRDLTLAPEFFENTSHIEELRISLSSCSGSGSSGSFCIDWVTMSGFRVPIEDLSLVRKLILDGTVGQRTLEDVVRSTPHLVSVVFIDCEVITYRPVSRVLGTLPKTVPTPVDANAFVKAISEERGAGTNAGVPKNLVVNGTLEGERLEEFRSLLGNPS